MEKDAGFLELKRDFTVALVLTLPVFLLEMSGHLIPAAHSLIHATIGLQASWYLQFVLTSLVLFVPGRRRARNCRSRRWSTG